MKNTLLIGVFAFGVLTAASLMCANPANALTFDVPISPLYGSTENTGSTADLFFDFSDIKSGQVQLDLTIKNTTPTSGSSPDKLFPNSTLVGVGFDLASNIIGGSYNPLSTVFTQLYQDSELPNITPINNAITPTNGNSKNPKLEVSELPPFGIFDIGLRSSGSGNFVGGNPNAGLTDGQSATVRFIFNTLLNADTLGGNFLTGFQNGGGLRTVARFQQVVGANATSDKVLGGPPTTTPVPTPALLPGLIGIGFAALRKKKQEAETAQNA